MKKLLVGIFSILSLTIIIFTSQTSCKKESVTNTVCTKSIQGLWIGNQQNATSGQAFSWSIRTDGTASYENIISGTRQLCVGTWTLVNSTFTANTTCIYGVAGNVGATQTFTAQYDSSTGLMSNGTWTTITPVSDSGTFTLTEDN